MPFNPLNYPLTFTLPSFVSNASAWVKHIPFAFTLTSMLRPRVFVELGTHNGDSYMAFCQAVSTLGIETQCTAIDSWEGDAHTGPYQNPLPQLKALHDPVYGSFSRLFQSTFDAACGTFADGSIDLLHIDGLHTYEAVRHDYETWLPKLSPGGVVLFHDTSVVQDDFGVHRIFAELAAIYPSFNFPHGYGLGIVAPNAKTPAAMMEFLTDANADAQAVHTCYAALGDRVGMLKTMHLAVGYWVGTQCVINDARQHQNLPVDPESERLTNAFQRPLEYLDNQTRSLRELLAVIGNSNAVQASPGSSR